MYVLPSIPLLRTSMTSRRHPPTERAILKTEIAYGLAPPPVRIEKINGTVKRQKRAKRKMKRKKRMTSARGTRAKRLRYVPRRKGLCLPLRRSLA